MPCNNNGKCGIKDNKKIAVKNLSHSNNKSKKVSNDCCFLYQHIGLNRVINPKPIQYRPYLSICPPECKKCSNSQSDHVISGSSKCSKDSKRYKHYRGIFGRGNCQFVNPYCEDVCPIAPGNASLSGSCLGSNSCSSSSSSKSSCGSCSAPSACVSCPSDKPCCSSCKHCRVQKYYKENRNPLFYNPRYNYKISATTGDVCHKNGGKCNKKDKKKNDKNNNDRNGKIDYKKKIEQDKKRPGILVEVLNDCFKIDGQKRKTLKLEVGKTHTFNVVQETKNGLYKHHFVFTEENKGGKMINGKCVFPKTMRGAPKATANGVIKLKITKTTPKCFYYHDVNTNFFGGKVIVVEGKNSK